MNVTIRPGVLSDVPFLDSLQKLHAKQVGWMPTKQLEGKIKLGHVLIAEAIESAEGRVLSAESDSSLPSTQHSAPSTPVGYCIGTDQYFKRDDVGIIYQMNVVPMKQRGLIGATLLKAMFDRAAYGCKLFCCWCAQDIEANYFWESLGFIPLAFRAGSRGKERVHIFWQRRIRAGDTTTPYWFPSQTASGSIREDRLVFPIPPGTLWSDAKPMVFPGTNGDEPKQLPTPKQKKRKDATAIRPANVPAGGLWFAVPQTPASEPKPKREPKQKVKNDPRLVAAARELRDRWLEQVNSGHSLPEAAGKYDVSRQIQRRQDATENLPLLPAA
jgi:hypothetical protein